MGAGRLRDRIVIQDVTVTKDAYGASTEVWADWKTVWGRNVVRWSGEKDYDQQTQNITRMVFEIRYLSGVTAKKRILWDGRTFDIEGVTNPDGLKKYMHVTCEERV